MNEKPMLFPITPSEFWKQIRTTIDEVVTERLSQQNISPTKSHLPDTILLKVSDVCEIFQVSKPTLYKWRKQNKLKRFKVKSRRYFNRADIDNIINHARTNIED
jgi:predicted DNA-binding transcriptional regulator AlpA